MKTHELLEMASLDAMGVLDAHEREEFERAFASAPPEVQAQIRREQTRLAAFEAVLPHVQPPLGLKAKVMAALREAMAGVPFASRSGEDIVARIRPVSGVNSLWRVGALASAAAAIALAFTTLQLKSEYDDISATQRSNAMIDDIRNRFGPGFDRVLLGEDTEIIQLRSVVASAANGTNAMVRPTGVLLVDLKSNSGRLVAQGLSNAEEYELVMLDSEGRQLSKVLSFRGSPAQMEYRSIVGVTLENVASIALVRISDGITVLNAKLA